MFRLFSTFFKRTNAFKAMWRWSGNPGAGRLKDWEGISLVVQWWRIHIAVLDAGYPGVGSLDPRCCAPWLLSPFTHSRALWGGVQQAVCSMTREIKTATENTITPNDWMKRNLIRVITDWRQRQRPWQTQKELPYHMIGWLLCSPTQPQNKQ